MVHRAWGGMLNLFKQPLQVLKMKRKSYLLTDSSSLFALALFFLACLPQSLHAQDVSEQQLVVQACLNDSLLLTYFSRSDSTRTAMYILDNGVLNNKIELFMKEERVHFASKEFIFFHNLSTLSFSRCEVEAMNADVAFFANMEGLKVTCKLKKMEDIWQVSSIELNEQ